jgi:uncharacterized protein (TIGR04255 family)
MPDTLPKFDRPPVVETVLSAQFARLPKFRTAHAGVFRESYLGKEWSTLEEQPRIDDHFERFGDERKWGMAGGIRFSAIESQRTQIIGVDVTRMIQVQDSRFIYNWRKGESVAYPSYDTTRREFDKLYARFRDFTGLQNLGEIEENQWEVSYVNHLLKGDLWDSPSDWAQIFPWLRRPQEALGPDGVQVGWDLVLPNERGRLHIHLYHGRISMDGPEALILDLTARGPASKLPDFSVVDGFQIGHSAIGRSFAAMTSEKAHAHWGRTQ